MSNSEATSGVDSFLLYGKETTYGTDPGTVSTPIGIAKNFRPNTNNNNIYVRGFKDTEYDGRNVFKAKGGKAEHSFSIDVDVLEWGWLELVLGSYSTNTYSEANNPPSATVHRCIDNPGDASTDRDGYFLGSVINGCTIKTSVGETVTATLDFMSAKRENDTSILSNQDITETNPYTFAGASIELPNGTPLDNIIDSIEITITNNWEIMYGLGSRLGQKAKAKARDYKIKFTVKYLDNDLLNKVLGSATPTATTEPTENATLTVKFANSDGDELEINFTKFVFDTTSGSEEATEIISEDFEGTAYSCEANYSSA